MKKLIFITIYLLFFNLFFPIWGKSTYQIKLKDGTLIKGKIIKKTKKYYIIKPKYLGEIKIKKSEVTTKKKVKKKKKTKKSVTSIFSTGLNLGYYRAISHINNINLNGFGSNLWFRAEFLNEPILDQIVFDVHVGLQYFGSSNLDQNRLLTFYPGLSALYRIMKTTNLSILTGIGYRFGITQFTFDGEKFNEKSNIFTFTNTIYFHYIPKVLLGVYLNLDLSIESRIYTFINPGISLGYKF